MQSLQHNISRLPTAGRSYPSLGHSGEVIRFRPRVEPRRGLHPALGVLLFLAVSAACWSGIFYLTVVLCGF